LKAGDSTALISSDTLAAGPDGRLQGDLAVTAEKPMAAIAGLAGSRSGAVNRTGAAGAAAATATSGARPVDLVVQFRDGRTWLGPFALAPAPRLF
jgi:thiamine monophosphate synthase